MVNSTIAPIVIPKVVFSGCKTPGTGEYEEISVWKFDEAAAARVVQKKRITMNTSK
jgi:hypothetical protein